MEKFGIENIKVLAGIIVDGVNQGFESFGDGFQASDLASFIDEIMALVSASSGFKELGNEIKDFSTDEAAEFAAFVQAKAVTLIKAQVDDEAKEAAIVELTEASTEMIVANIRFGFAVKAVRDLGKAA